jgi:hypothetical protein
MELPLVIENAERHKSKIMQTVSEINKTLNELIAPLFPMKVKDFGDLHKKIQETVNPFLAEFKMKYGVWRVRINGELAYSPIDCFDLKEDFTKDGRCTSYDKWGTMNKMWFCAFSPEFEGNKTPIEAKTEVETNRLAAKILNMEVDISNIKDNLSEQEKDLIEMKKAYQKRLTA